MRKILIIAITLFIPIISSYGEIIPLSKKFNWCGMDGNLMDLKSSTLPYFLATNSSKRINKLVDCPLNLIFKESEQSIYEPVALKKEDRTLCIYVHKKSGKYFDTGKIIRCAI